MDSVTSYDFVWAAEGRHQWLLYSGTVGHVFLSTLSGLWFAQISVLLCVRV